MSNAARRRIAEASLQLFNSRGYKSVTMREIAKHLGMSSKTLYAHFSSKEEIAEDVLDLLIEKIRIRTRDVLDMAGDPIVKLRKISSLIQLELTTINPLLLRDISLYLPHLQENLSLRRKNQGLLIQELIREGQAAGLIRKNIDPQMAAQAYLGIFQAAANPRLTDHYAYSLHELLDFFIEVFFIGICEKQQN